MNFTILFGWWLVDGGTGKWVVMQCGWCLRTASPLRTGSPDCTITYIASLPKNGALRYR